MTSKAHIVVPAVTVCLAAGIAAGVATGQSGTGNPGLPQHERPGNGAALVGAGVALLVAMTMRIGYVLRERRREPNKTYSISNRGLSIRRWLTAGQYIRVLAAYLLFSVVLCCMGLWLRAIGD